MILDKRLTYSEHLRGARTFGRISQLHPLLSNPAPNPKMDIMLYKLHIRPILAYASPHGPSLARDDLKEFLDKLNRGIFEKTLASENPALKMTTAQKTYMEDFEDP
ncbi:hypothetical protein Trydic_g22562 [Trypoxylus dichotomus]